MKYLDKRDLADRKKRPATYLNFMLWSSTKNKHLYDFSIVAEETRFHSNYTVSECAEDKYQKLNDFLWDNGDYSENLFYKSFVFETYEE